MKNYYDLMCCPKCGNLDIMQSAWVYVNDTIDFDGLEIYKCPDCGMVDEPIRLSVFIEDKVEELFKEGRLFIYEQPCGSLYCAFNDDKLLRDVWRCECKADGFFRLYDNGTEGLIEDDDDLETSINKGCTIGFEIEPEANRPRYYVPCVAEIIWEAIR